MQSTVTDLPLDLLDALVASGLRYQSATRVVRLLPDAGQHELLTSLRDNPDALREISSAFIGDVAESLRITHSAADVVRSHCRMEVA